MTSWRVTSTTVDWRPSTSSRLPFDPKGEMLTTGVVGDVVGLGLPAIVSSWPYLTESLGAAGLVYDDYDHLVAPARLADRGRSRTGARAARRALCRTSWPGTTSRSNSSQR